jgi:glycosyltransferase involved in cell wall biosynthesis
VLHVCTVGITARAFLLPILQRMRADGYAVWLACSDDADARAVAQQGIPFFPVHISRSISPTDILAVWRLYRFMRRMRFALVNTHTSKGGFVGRLAAHLARVPCIIYTAHGYTVHAAQPRLVQAFYRVLDNWIGKRTHLFISVTERVKNAIIELGSARPDNSISVYNGIDFARFAPERISPARIAEQRDAWGCTADAVVIGCASRLVPDKGLDVLLDAFARVAPHAPEALLVIAGDGPLHAALQHQADMLGVAARVRFIGWQEDVPALMAAFDLFCLPTMREGFGYVFLEAQAMGVPVVATAIEPLTETMAQGETALLVAPHDGTHLADALTRLVHDPAERRRLGANGAARVRRLFDQRRQLDQLAAVYRQCVALKLET